MFKDLGKIEKIPVAITIAGSDSSGGAGIQADLKTFAALNVHGTVAVTCITAQNTYSITAIECVKPDTVREQIRQVAEDMGINAGKTGMLYSREIIKVVSRAFTFSIDFFESSSS
jgi:hydroxymethylpyrimidine kinase/phosphomethylpyrimidine kinase